MMGAVAGELMALRDVLAELAQWADRCLDEERDRQLIAEYLTDSLFRLSSGGQAARAPF